MVFPCDVHDFMMRLQPTSNVSGLNDRPVDGSGVAVDEILPWYLTDSLMAGSVPPA